MTVGLPPGGDDDDDDKPSRKRKQLSPQALAEKTLVRREKSTRIKRKTRRVEEPAPVLSAAPTGSGGHAGRESACGGFVRSRNWHLANPVQGLIIQKVTRTFAVERYETSSSSWVAITGPGLDTYVTDPDSTVHGGDAEYWEAWRVTAGGAITPGGQDRFALCGLVPAAGLASLANTTKGTFTQRGEAVFYPTTATLGSLGFAVGNVGAAGDVPSRASDPAGALSGIVAAAGTVVYTVTSTWDSTWIGPPNTTDNPFIPPNAMSVVTTATA